MPDYLHYRDDDLNLHHVLDLTPDPLAFRMHSHTKCELYCFLQGKGCFRIEGTEYPLESGDILIMRPSEAHCIQLEPNHPYERVSIHFSPSLFDDMDPERALLAPFFRREAGRFNRFASASFQSSYYRECLMRSVAPVSNQRLQVLTFLPPLLHELCTANQLNTETPLNPSDSLMYHVIRYINDHLDAPLTQEALCSRFYISRAQLCRRFKQTTGAPLGEYIMVKRLTAARQFMAEGIPPTRVFSRCGYTDYSAFYRAYRKYFGHTPRQQLASYP